MDSKNCIKHENGWYKLYINGRVKELCDQKVYTDDIQKRWESMLEALRVAEDHMAATAHEESRPDGTITTQLPDSWPEGCQGSCQIQGETEEKGRGKNRMELVRETRNIMWETINEGAVPLPFWTVWDLMSYCTNCDYDSCTPDGDCELVKAFMAHGEPWKWDLASCLLTHQDWLICNTMGAHYVTVDDMEKGVVSLWECEPRKAWGVYSGHTDEDGKKEKPLAVVSTDKHFKAFRNAGIIQGALCVEVPARLFDEWNRRQEEDF